MHTTITDDVVIDRKGSAGIIRLNRPKALNSLTLPMVRAVVLALYDFAADPRIGSVVIAGEGERGFCAGGDIRAIYQSGRDGTDEAVSFWREEFRLNHAIAHYSKPYVALMDGITMGGGVGLSAHGSHRIVTERTRLAMPETGIGYFPDVGATWLLAHAPGEVGTWMALTGLDVGAADAIYAGFADRCVASADLPALVSAIGALPAEVGGDHVGAVIAKAAVDPGFGRLAANRTIIDRAFAHDTVEAIVAALESEPGDFAAETRSVIAGRSPTSLKLTLRLLRAARRSRSLAECLNRELGACQEILRNPDFFEGVRAAIIDKDRSPKWSPAALGDVDAVAIDRFFVPPIPPLFDDHDEKDAQS